MTKVKLTPNTTLYPVPVVLVTCGAGEDANVFTLNRIASCNAEPPMISISVRPSRASHDLIENLGEFVINFLGPEMELISDFVGSTTQRKINKWIETGLIQSPAAIVQPPLLADCIVSLECQVRHKLKLPSHTLFVAEVMMVHAEDGVLNENQEVDFAKVQGLIYRSTVVRERPIDKFNPATLLADVNDWRNKRS